MALDQRQLADYMRRMRQQGMNINAAPITMESQIAGQGMNINAAPITMESQIAEQVNAPVSSGMVSGYAAQGREAEMRKRAQDFSGEERAIEAQMAMAQQLRGREAPKGRTVGPYDVYMGPNWGESVAGLTNSIAGGLVQRSANKKDIALDEKRTEARLSKAMEEQSRYDQGFDLQTSEFKERVRAAGASEAASAAALAQQISGDAADDAYRILALEAANAPSKEWKDETYWKPPKDDGTDWKSGEDTVTYQRHENGSYRTTDKTALTQEQSAAIGSLTPYNTGTAGSLKPTAKSRDEVEERTFLSTQIKSLIGDITALAEEGKSTSGGGGAAVDMTPRFLKGFVENAFFDVDEQKVRAGLAYVDAVTKEAVTTGNLSNQDSDEIVTLRAGIGGLLPMQQVAKLQAIDAILQRNGLSLYDPVSAAPVEKKAYADMTIEELRAARNKKNNEAP